MAWTCLETPYGKPTQWPRVLTPGRGSSPARDRIQSLATHNYSSPFIDLGLSVEMFLDAGGPQRSSCLLCSHITARATCMSKGWRLLKSTRYWRYSSAQVRTKWLVPDLVGTCPCYCALYFSTLMVIVSFWFCFPFFTRCNMKWRWFSCQLAANQSPGMCCSLTAVSQHYRTGSDDVFVLHYRSSTQKRKLSSTVNKFGKPQWFDANSCTGNSAVLVGVTVPQFCWVMEKSFTAEIVFSTKLKPREVL